MKPKLQILFVLGSLSLFLGMAGQGGGGFGGAELKPEIRLKLYNEAIEHYEKAAAFHAEGRLKEALSEIRKATKTVSAFPEAYDLARRIYLELGDQVQATEQEEFFQRYAGHQGASLYRLRDKLVEEIRFREKFSKPPDVPVVPSLLLSGSLAGVLVLGMFYDYWRVMKGSKNEVEKNSIILEKFSGDEEYSEGPTWLFKLCVLILPVPILFALLILFGVRHSSDLVPVLLFGWAVLDLVIYTIFFADFSDAGGFRRSGTA